MNNVLADTYAINTFPISGSITKRKCLKWHECYARDLLWKNLSGVEEYMPVHSEKARKAERPLGSDKNAFGVQDNRDKGNPQTAAFECRFRHTRIFKSQGSHSNHLELMSIRIR
jgi:hypothetical protein